MGPVVHPHADLRFGLFASDLDADRVSVAFAVARAQMGVAADLNRFVQTRLDVDAIQSPDRAEAAFTTAAGDTGEVVVPVSTTGFEPWVRNGWVDLRPTGDDLLRLRVGVQPTVFGYRDSFTDPTRGFTHVSATFWETLVLAGLLDRRDMGITATSALAEGRLVLDAGLLNGADVSAERELNPEKDLVGRVRGEVVDGLELQGSVQYGARGEGAYVADTIVSMGAELEAGLTKWHAEALLGRQAVETDADLLSGIVPADREVPFLGFEVAGRADVPLSGEALETLAFVGRFGFFDPDKAETDATGWGVGNLSALLHWAEAGRAGQVITGAGWQIDYPIDATLPIGHAFALQSYWVF